MDYQPTEKEPFAYLDLQKTSPYLFYPADIMHAYHKNSTN